MKAIETIIKIRQTTKERYGVDYGFLKPEAREKLKDPVIREKHRQDKTIPELQDMKNQGYSMIYGCGHAKYMGV